MQKPNYYAIIPANVRYDKSITANAKLLYGEITALANKEGYCFATNKYFANLYGVSTKTVSLWIKSLIDNGYIYSQIEYKENSKEIERRRLWIIHTTNEEPNVKTSLQKCKEGMNKNVKTPPHKNVKTPPHKNVKDNNINNNNINNNNINNNKKKSKIDTKIKFIENKCLEYDLEDEVIEILSRFFRNLLENNKLVTEDKVNAILAKLADVDKKTQLNAIQFSLDMGYMNIDPAWLRKSFTSKKDSSIYWEDNNKPMTEEEQKEYFERLKHCKSF